MRKPPRIAALALAVAALAAGGGEALAAGGPRIEVAFVLDATGSMGPWIDAARRRIADIATDLASGDPPPDVRFALVGYRDRGDDFVVRVDDFTDRLAEMKARLDRTTADGGGDYPEAVLEALEAGITQLDWTLGDDRVVKLLYLVGDAPPNVYPDSPDEELLLGEALERGIVLHTIACGSMDRRGQDFFERVARLSEGRPFRLGEVSRAGADDRRPTLISASGATGATSLEAAVSGSARAYSGSVGVRFEPKPRPAVAVTALAAPRVDAGGLLGAHVRYVADATAWSDLWAAYVSTLPGDPPPPPAVDFARHAVLALGGADAGVALERVEADASVRFAIVRPDPTPGVRFVLVPAGDVVVAAAPDGGAR